MFHGLFKVVAMPVDMSETNKKNQNKISFFVYVEPSIVLGYWKKKESAFDSQTEGLLLFMKINTIEMSVKEYATRHTLTLFNR